MNACRFKAGIIQIIPDFLDSFFDFLPVEGFFEIDLYIGSAGKFNVVLIVL